MKTKEFIKKVEDLGYTVEDTGVTYEVYNSILICAVIYKKDNRVSLFYRCLADNDLSKVCVEYAQTPIEEREEEEKFYLQKMKSFYDTRYNDVLAFLNFDKSLNQYFLFNNGQYGDYKTQFTQKEIDKIKEEQHTDLSEFKQIPVEEVEEK